MKQPQALTLRMLRGEFGIHFRDPTNKTVVEFGGLGKIKASWFFNLNNWVDGDAIHGNGE